jgi:hypothetical protein
LLQLGKTVIIKEALANGRVFKTKNSAIIKALSDVDVMAKISGRHRCYCTPICHG